MDLLSVILIAVGLAMDCFAVSTMKGVQTAKSGDKSRWAWPLLMAVLLGLFQGGMPLIGYAAGSLFVEIIDKYDHWLALVLLGFIGGKMIWEGLHPETENEDEAKNVWSLPTLLTLAVATSIDALATGLILTPYDWKTVLLDVAIIGLASVFFSRLGFRIGQAVGKRLPINVEVLGGLVLIGIGVKIFAEGMGWL